MAATRLPARGHRLRHAGFLAGVVVSPCTSATSRLPVPRPAAHRQPPPHSSRAPMSRALARFVVAAPPQLLYRSALGPSGGCSTARVRRYGLLPVLPPRARGPAGGIGTTVWAAAVVRGAVGTAAAASGGAVQPIVVVVESPTKAKKIQGFLGDQYRVLASYGHIRDLPSRNGSVQPDSDFSMDWQLLPAAGPRLAEIAGAAVGSPLLLLATDPDREGEAISWHIEQELQRRGVMRRVGAVQRITFTEITRSAITTAMKEGRQVSQPLVDAYLARRALDYLVGFHLSPVLWRKLPGARSAGRVQSVALRLVCEREAAVERFNSVAYWSITAALAPRSPPSPAAAASLIARLTHVDGRRLGPMDISSREMAEELTRRIQSGPVIVSRVSSRQLQRHPTAPFTTSTLQQEASGRLGFGAARTMRVAQQLYEGAGTGEGLITYMRTDGVQLSAEAVQELRKTNEAMYGKDAVPPQPRQYKSRAKNAQEAHEAIRPTRPAAMTPASLPSSLDADQRALYELIWRRAVASQMTSAVYDVVTVELAADGGKLGLRASGSVLRQPGFLRAYGDDDSDDEDAAAAASSGSVNEDDAVAAGRENQGLAAEQLLQLTEGSPLLPRSVCPLQHWTRPPPRFTEASLVRALEERGIGRPSTYAPTMSLLQDRGYVSREGRSLLPTSLGRVLTSFLEHYFGKYVDYTFTSGLEEQLDDVAGGKAAWRQVLSTFWAPFHGSVNAMSAIRTTEVFDVLDLALQGYLFPPPAAAAVAAAPAFLSATPGSGRTGAVIDVTARAVVAAPPVAATATAPSVSSDSRLCPKCGRGRLVLKPSRYGGFIGCSLFADESVQCGYARPLLPVTGGDAGSTSDSDGDGGGMAANGTERLLGSDPETGEAVWVRLGPYGLYVQLGEAVRAAPKTTKKKVAKRGSKKGAAEAEGVAEGKPAKPKRAAVPKAKGLTIQGVTLEEALGLLALPRALGSHPDDGQPVVANTGPFGPYVAHAGTSASLGRRATPQDVDLATALQLLAAKRAREAEREARGLPPRRRRGAIKATKSKSGGASGYTVLLRQRWQAAKEADPQAVYREVVSATAAEWRALGLQEQRRFSEAAAEAAVDAAAEATPSVPAATRPRAATGAAAAATRTKVSGTRKVATARGGGAGRAAGGRSKPAAASAAAAATASASVTATATARRPNPYMSFCKAQRPSIKAAHPGASLGDVSRLLGAGWKALSEEQKAAYR